ncbi:sentrin-specific protease 8 [Drosophila grimshawi]|uniref:GH16114 n=1 Tax=Drosophila grimshawi TaxID=7222 RepID=B4J3H7_DROGR|nr:sentrin-specific protease 8 [Drosophila grimshawi]EDV96179.1 GH16114 [Drosophila grimshawi]
MRKTKSGKMKQKQPETLTRHRRLLLTKASINGDYLRGQENGVNGGISLRYQEILLRHSDVQLLQGPHELNDRLIGLHYAYLQSRRYKREPELCFLLPALADGLRQLDAKEQRCLVRDMQLASKQFIFIPMSEDEHWSLLLVARPDRRIYYFDSQDNRHLNLARLLKERLRNLLGGENYGFTVGRCLQQAAHQPHESGVHLMCMTDNMADYVWRCGYATSTLLVSVQEVRDKRKNQLQLIRTLGGYLPNVSCAAATCHAQLLSSSCSSTSSSSCKSTSVSSTVALP